MRASASGIQSPGGAPYNSPAVEPRKGRTPGKRPQKQMRTPGWHKAWRKNAALFQNAANTKNTRPQRLGASLRSGPRHYMSPQVPWVPFPFLWIYRGSVRWRSLHRLTKSRRPLRGFKLGGHAPAVILISVRLRLTRTFGVTHANAWGLRPFARTHAVARANVRPNGLTRGAPNGAPTSDLSRALPSTENLNRA